MSASSPAVQHAGMTARSSNRSYAGRLLLAALFAALLGGCASAPALPPEVTPQASAHALQHRSLLDPRLQRFIALQTGKPHPIAQPWTLQDLSLAALYFHPSLKVNRANAQLAQADLQIARQYPNPSLQLGLKYGAAAGLLAPSPWTVGMAIGLLLQSQAQRTSETSRAEAGVHAAQLLLSGARWTVRDQVQQAYVSLWAAQQRAHLQQRVLEADLALQGRTAARAQAGVDSPLAAALAQQAAQNAALQKSRDIGAEGAARVALAGAMGLPVAALQGVKIDFSALHSLPTLPDATQLTQLRRKALEQRDDVRAAWQEVLSAQAALRLAQAQSDGGPPSIAPGAERDQGVNRLMLGARIPLPLFNQHQGQIAAARARLSLREALLKQTQARVLVRIEQSETALQTAQDRVRQAEQLIAANRALLNADLAAQHRGLLGPEPALRAQLRLLSTEQAALQARTDQWQALGALQGALEQPILSAARSRPSNSAPPAVMPPTVAPHLSQVIWRKE